jgi:4-hydroxy-tetrahydrodipicolinate synthase
MIDKVSRIIAAVGDDVGILEGWGGYYMLEAITVGICGVMPGVPISDLLNRVFKARQAGDGERAYDLFAPLLPFMNFSLQDIELFLQIEKRLCVRRGLFKNSRCRSITLSPSDQALKHIDFLLDQIERFL